VTTTTLGTINSVHFLSNLLIVSKTNVAITFKIYYGFDVYTYLYGEKDLGSMLSVGLASLFMLIALFS